MLVLLTLNVSIQKSTGLKLSKLVQFSRFDASIIHAYNALEMIRVYQIVQAENLTGFATFYAVLRVFIEKAHN